MSSSTASGSASDLSRQRRRSQSSLRQIVSRLFADWFGISLLFTMWLSMLLMLLHTVVIPRTCSQRWPAWVPLLGGLRSMLRSGASSRPECVTPLVGGHNVASAPLSTTSEVITTFTIPDDALGLAVVLLALAAMPLILSFGAALIAKWQQSPRARHSFDAETEKPAPEWSLREKQWKNEAVRQIHKLWTIESRRALQAQHRMTQHACLYGFASSAVLAWTLLMNSIGGFATQTRMITIAAASAAFTSFCLSFGRITVRASIRDSSARMFAYALRALITSVLAAILLCALLWHHSGSGAAVAGATQAVKDGAALSEQAIKGPTGFMMIGMLVALIGEGILSQLTSRAASAMNLSAAQSGADAKQLSAVDGITEHDLLRLGEEGIDSIHALAMASTAYLYFSTPYTLQRICDWQDQALLITFVGLAKAQTCREKLMIRGAIDLQRKADFLVSADAAADKTFEIIRSSLGFISVEQARESLYPLANDETIRRLRIYQRGAVSEAVAPTTAPA